MISPRDLCTLEGAKDYVFPAIKQSSDSVLQRLIGRASSWLEEYLARSLALAQYSERRNGTGTGQIMARHYPIVAVQSLWVDDAQVQVAPVTTAGESLIGGGFMDTSRFIYLRGGFGPIVSRSEFRRGTQNVLIQYTAGYITPGILRLAALPAWQPSANYAAGQQVIVGSIVFAAQNAGVSGGAPPAWPTQTGTLIVDGSVTWLAAFPFQPPVAGATLLPESIEMAAIELVGLQYRQRDRIGDTGTGIGPERVNYFMGAMTKTTQESLKPFRNVVPDWEVIP